MSRMTGYMSGHRLNPEMPDKRDPYGIEHHLGFDITSIFPAVIDVTDEFEDAHPFRARHRTFGLMAPRLLDPSTKTYQENFQLGQVLRSRLEAVFDLRGEENFSMCQCRGELGHAGHGKTFQGEYVTRWSDLERYRRGDGSKTVKYACLCPYLTEGVDTYGVIGEGTFGIAFIAREISEGVAHEDLSRFAIKVQAHRTQVDDMLEDLPAPEMVPFREPTGEEHYIPEEALLLIYLNESDRFPTVDSIYTHGVLWAIVMDACVGPSPESFGEINTKRLRKRGLDGGVNIYRYFFPTFPAFSGAYLKGINKQPVLDEMQGCKIAGQFLTGINQMADMRVYHADISVNNYLMDQDLNVQLIDMGQVNFSLNEQDFQSTAGRTIPFQEYQMRPELAIEYMKVEQVNTSTAEWGRVYLPFDHRDESLWKYSTLVYGFLHGYWPWEDPSPLAHIWHGEYSGEYRDPLYRDIAARRLRMINQDITVNETLSQDCRDFLQSALSRNLDERPSLQEMNSFPWFSQWSAEESESGRSLKRPRVDEFESDNDGPRRAKRTATAQH